MIAGKTAEAIAVKCLFIVYLFVGIEVFASLVLLFFHLKPDYEHLPFYQDFSVFYEVAGRMHAGAASEIYKESTEDLLHSTQGLTPRYLSNPFVNPPPFMLMVYPLGFMSKVAALRLWMTAGLALWLAVFYLPAVKGNFQKLLHQSWFSRFYVFFILCTAYLYPAIELGQVDLFTGPVIIATLCYRRSRPVLSGFLLGLLIIKPHIVLLFPLLLLLEKNFKALLSAFLSVSALMAITVALFGLSIWQDYFSSLRIYEKIMETDAFGTAKSMISFYQFLRFFYVAPGTAILAQFGIGMALTLLCASLHARIKDDKIQVALWIILALMLSPYMLIYNLSSVLLPALVVADCCLLLPSFAAIALAIVFAGLPLWPSLHIMPIYGVPFALLAGVFYLLYIGIYRPYSLHEQPSQHSS